MGIFFKRIPIFNRAPMTLYVMFDGQRAPIPVGHSELPEQALRIALNQNPIMGSQDPHNPGMSGARYLIVTEGEEGWNEPMTKDEWEEHCNRPCREDETVWFKDRYGEDPKAKLIQRGSRNSVAAKNRFEAGGVPKGIADFTQKDA